jgi:hypothetical protein
MNEDELIQPSYYIDEGIPGVGDRPSWLSEKFKTVADLGKSYAELEKKFSTVPEEYDLSKSKFIDPDYEPFQDFLTLAREKRVPKDVVDKMVDSFDKYLDEFSSDPAEEIKKLGENATDRLAVLDNWAKANLTDDSYNALTSNLKSAGAIRALEELRGKMMSNNTMVPSGNESASTNAPTLDELKAELTNNLEKYKTDEKYRRDLQGRLEQAAKTSPSNYIDKGGY